MIPTSPRYAVYYVPRQGSALERLGASLLGRDIYNGEPLARPALDGVAPDELDLLTRNARRYGLHATLKPPFFLKPGVTEDDIIRAAENFSSVRLPLPLPALRVTRIGSFFALAMQPRTEEEAEEAENIGHLAREAVRFFDRHRAAPLEDELKRRREKGLTPRQERHLVRWGYPYVFDEFRFHLTLTDSIRDSATAALLESGLTRYMAPALEGNSIEALCICRSDDIGNFTLLHRAEFLPGPCPARNTHHRLF